MRVSKEGVVSDFEVTEKMLKHFINEIHRETFSILPRPRVVVAVPLDITEVERKAVQDAVVNAGAREAYLIETPMAAAIGARLPIQDATGQLIVDFGAGITNIAVLALGGIVSWKALRLGGDQLNRDIIHYIREQCQVLLGEKTAEHLKTTVGTANPDEPIIEAKVRGRDVTTGLPREIIVNNQYIREAMSRSLSTMIDAIQQVIEATPPELVADLYERGIMLSGGGSQLRGLDAVIAERLEIPVRLLEDPTTTVVRGIGIVLQNIDSAKHLFQMTVTSLD
jgi:rod shape-determining protein MreB